MEHCDRVIIDIRVFNIAKRSLQSGGSESEWENESLHETCHLIPVQEQLCQVFIFPLLLQHPFSYE